MMKVLDNQLFDEVLERAKASPRLRMNYDLRTQAEVPGWTDGSQRMLTVLEMGTVIPIHRHRETSETVIVVRGKVKEVLFDEQGREIDSCVLEYGGPCPGGAGAEGGVSYLCVPGAGVGDFRGEGPAV